MKFQELSNDQRRECVNTRQRYVAYRDAKLKARGYRGSMVWNRSKDAEYLIRSSYDKNGIRRQSSLGPRSENTERIKADYDLGRSEAEDRLKELKAVLASQSAINRAIGLGRVPLIGAKIIRAIDEAGMLGAGIRILGTNAIYAYEAAAGVFIDAGLTTTEDIDLLLDSRRGLIFSSATDISEHSLLHILQKVDRSFERSNQTFRAVNREGYLVDLIRPLPTPPWKSEPEPIGADTNDLEAVQIEGLGWHESAPSFEAIAIDERGEPLRIVTTDPRVWAAHKLWLSKRKNREPIQRKRDEAQAHVVAGLVTEYLLHLPFDPEHLRMLPKEVVEDAASLFSPRTQS